MKSVALVGLVALALLLSGCVQPCPEIAQFVIDSKNLVSVGACSQEELTIDGKTVHEVKIIHGPAMDCPAGCIYPSFRGIVDGQEIFEIKTPVSSPKLIHDVCGFDEEIIKHEGSYRLSYVYKGTPGGRLIISDPGNLVGLAGPRRESVFDKSQLDSTSYTFESIPDCVSSPWCRNFNRLMDKRAKELLEEEGINSDDLVHPLGEIYDRENATSAKLDCSVKKEVISNVEFFDSEKECTHKVLINVAKETEKYLGCE